MARKPSQSGPIAVYGATGYTGKLVAAELCRRGLECVLSGRNPDKLRSLAERLEADIPTVPTAVDDPAALRALLADCAAVVNCAGPFALHGEAVVEAAIETGTHYVDTTGEQAFMKRVIDLHDDAAERAGVAVVCAMGFDYVPGDLAARLAADGLEPLDELRIAYATRAFGASRGTLKSTFGIMAAPWLVYRDGDWRAAPTVLEREQVDFPGPAGRQLCVTYPSGEVLTVPRHTEVRDVVSLINTSTFMSLRPAAPLTPYLVPGVKLAMRTPLRAGLNALVGRGAEGPSAAERAAMEFTILVDARGPQGNRRVVVRGSDVYGLTAVTAVHGALLQTQRGYDRAGALGPAAAFDAQNFFHYLAEHGVRVGRGVPGQAVAA